MNERIKYLNILVLLIFLVGQVQYAYASYFCTMKNAETSSPTMTMSTDDESTVQFTERNGFAQPVSSQQIVQASCMQVQLTEKKVVDNFTNTDKSFSHFVGIVAVLQSQDEISQLSNNNFVQFSRTDSPPLDITTFNSNLRI